MQILKWHSYILIRRGYIISKDNGKLWVEYGKYKSQNIKEKLIIEYSPLVKYVAGRLNIYFGQNVEYDDLVGYGVFGLIDAIDKYDYNKGVKFETYATLRIRGSIIDSIRKADWLPRSLRQKQKNIDKIYNKYENEYGRIANDEEMANELNIPIVNFRKQLSQIHSGTLISLDEYIDLNQGYNQITSIKDEMAQPQDIIENNEVLESLAVSIEGLTEKEKIVITLYYYEELTLKEISFVLGVSESRISQLHSKAIVKLRNKLAISMWKRELIWKMVKT